MGRRPPSAGLDCDAVALFPNVGEKHVHHRLVVHHYGHFAQSGFGMFASHPVVARGKEKESLDLPRGDATALVDGERLVMFRDTAGDGSLKLRATSSPAIDGDAKGSGGRRQSGSSNPDDRQQDEDGFVAGVASGVIDA